ncbi:Meiosis protein MEI2 [Paramyrothecium foliicola]|nr:Meiosis protein MEI2 [Paramyrothecium foliicola]
MTLPLDLSFNVSSPRSSSRGADSFKGTPDTRLTAFSPEDGTTKSASRNVSDITPQDTTPHKRTKNEFVELSFIDKDPFVTSHASLVSRLSPTASAFNPFRPTIAHGAHGSTGVVSATFSANLGLSRHLKITSPEIITVPDVYKWLADLDGKGTERHGVNSVFVHDRQAFLHFSDIRDAYFVHANVHMADKSWKADYESVTQYAPYDQVATLPGQIVLFAGAAPGSIIDTAWGVEVVKAFLQKHGDLFAFVKHASFPDGSFRAIAEFCDTSVVVHVLRACSTFINIEGMNLAVAPVGQDTGRQAGVTEALQELAISKEQPSQVHHRYGQKPVAVQAACNTSDMRMHPPLSMYPFMLRTPLSSTMQYTFDPFHATAHSSPLSPLGSLMPFAPQYPVTSTVYQTPPSPPLTASNSYSPSKALAGAVRADVRRQNAARVSRFPFNTSTGHHNHVDTGRIREGIDVRTTIMLRNIPNKVDQAMLKRLVDESSWGKYDFMYLRIDFANDCNVGYAFINFVDGKDCLVQKFRNSSVMLEAPHYRPKVDASSSRQLFFTSNGPVPELAGQEEPFPGPDNQSKMKRSCENAEHVGQHFRDEQRRRRSQYDRGTRLAALEEYDYETAIQHIYGGTT